MSSEDSRIVDQVDGWKTQERKSRDARFKFIFKFLTNFIILVSLVLGSVYIFLPLYRAHLQAAEEENAEIEKAEERRLRRQETRRALDELLWVKCVNTFDLDKCKSIARKAVLECIQGKERPHCSYNTCGASIAINCLYEKLEIE